MPWQKMTRRQHLAALAKSTETRRDQARDHAATVGPLIQFYRTKHGMGYRRIAHMLNLSGYSPPRGHTWHPTTVVRVWQTYLSQPIQLPLPETTP